jgi:hypothetical protein
MPRCALCNGELATVSRDEVADVVPARSLIWATEFYRCSACGHVYWNGTHWSRIRARIDASFPMAAYALDSPPNDPTSS